MTNNLKRKKDKKLSILQTATELFIKNGYKKTSIAEIAKEAKASQVTLYKYYSSKVVLARAVVIKMIDDGYAQYGQALDNDKKTFKEKMEDMMVSGVSFSKEINDDFVVFMYEEFSGRHGDTSVSKAYNASKRTFWKKLLDQGRAEGAVNPEVTDDGALLYLDMFIGYAMNSKSTDPHMALAIKKHEGDLMHLFFYGIMGR